MKNGSKPTQSWKGNTSAPIEPSRYRWQSGEASSPSTNAPVQPVSRNWVSFVLIFLSLGMLSGFVALLLYAPAKTPVITVLIHQYNWPMPPIEWSQEDIEGYEKLHGKNIQWIPTGSKWGNRAEAIEDLKGTLRDSKALAARTGSLVVYLCAHGMVNEEGIPCILPSNASPIVPAQWISIADIVSAIEGQVDDGVHTMLVLDCVHQRANWNAAQIDNLFIERLEAWTKDHLPRHLQILTSCSQDEEALGGRDLKASAFGRFFQLGLSGAADQASSAEYISVGNGDGFTDSHELVEFVRENVSRWIEAHRGTVQTPRILAAQATAQRLSVALKSWEVQQLAAAVTMSNLAPETISPEAMGKLWKNWELLRQYKVYREDPQRWSELEGRLVWLEKLAVAGKAYSDLASKQVYPELDKLLEQAVEKARACEQSPYSLSRSQILQLGVQGMPLKTALPSLELKELFGWIRHERANEVRGWLDNALESDSIASLQKLDESTDIVDKGGMFNELNFAQLLRRYKVSSAWPNMEQMKNALRLREQSERLAIHGDLRALPQRKGELTLLDQHRRTSEDLLFVGHSEDRTEGVLSSLAAFSRTIQTASAKKALLERAWDLRDRGLVEAPYWIAYFCGPGGDTSVISKVSSPTDDLDPTKALSSLLSAPRMETIDRSMVTVLQRVLRGLHDLASQLIASPTDGKQDSIESSLLEIEKDLAILSQSIDRKIETLLIEETNASGNLREIARLLELPFLTSDRRNDLRSKYDRLLRDSQEQVKKVASNREKLLELFPTQKKEEMATDPVAPVEDKSTPKVSAYYDQVREWGQHPLLLLLRLRPSTETPPEGGSSIHLHALNNQLRRHLQNIQSFQGRQLEDWSLASGVELFPSVAKTPWTLLCMAEHIERSFLKLAPPSLESNAVRDLRKVAIQEMLMWNAERQLGDFYAFGDPTLKLGHGSEYFHTATKQCMNAALLASDPSPEMKRMARELEERLNYFDFVSKSGLQMSLAIGPPQRNQQDRMVDVTIQPGFETRPLLRDGSGSLPNGMAFALVRNGEEIIPQVRQGVRFPTTPEPSQSSFLCPALERNSRHDLVVVFRGHEYKTSMLLGQAITVDFRPKRYDTAEVVLFGDRLRQPSILFILDCSWSMGEPLPIESIDATTTSKLEIAKQHVLQLIEQMASQPDARLGVRLFGHRIGWSRPALDKNGFPMGKSQIVPQPNYPGKIPQDVVPSTDVEAIVPLGRFTPEMLGPLRGTLAKVVPWGQSPLYYSIMQSFQDFSADDALTAKSIVVITDGDNFQFSVSGRPGGESGGSTTLEDVERAWKSSKIPLFVLGVGMSEKSEPSVRKTLQSLAEKTKGKYYDIEKGGDLLRALSEQLSLGTYRVSRQGSSKDTPTESSLNNPVSIPGLGDGSEKFKIEFGDTSQEFELLGGESLEMYLRGEGQQIVSRPYDRFSPISALLSRKGDSKRLVARVHRSSELGDALQFPVSIQDPDSHFTPRPSQVWVEVSPVGGEELKGKRTYYFYDAHYQPHTPVPLVSWLATDWPRSATMADVRVWVKDQTTPSALTIPMSSLRNDVSRYESGVEVPGMEGLRVKVQILENRLEPNSLELMVTEIHGQRSSGVGSCRILLEGNGTNLPFRVIRRFEPENGLAVHSFVFESAAGKAILQSREAKIELATKATMQEGAWQIDGNQSIRVELARESELLPLQISSGKP